MEKQIITRNLSYGVLTWLIPFTISLLLFQDGKLIISFDLFKSVMVTVDAIVGCLCYYLYFRAVKRDFFRNSLILGICWPVLNVTLDVIVKVPMMGGSIQSYFIYFGILYSIYPAMGLMVGALLDIKTRQPVHEVV